MPVSEQDASLGEKPTWGYRNNTQKLAIHEAAPAQNPPGPGTHKPHFWMSYVYVFSVRRDRDARGAIFFILPRDPTGRSTILLIVVAEKPRCAVFQQPLTPTGDSESLLRSPCSMGLVVPRPIGKLKPCCFHKSFRGRYAGGRHVTKTICPLGSRRRKSSRAPNQTSQTKSTCFSWWFAPPSL